MNFQISVHDINKHARAPASEILRGIIGQSAILERRNIRNDLDDPDIQRLIQEIESKVAIMTELAQPNKRK